METCSAQCGCRDLDREAGQGHGGEQRHRMDRRDLEPGDGLHKDQRGLRQLLCRSLLGTLSWGSGHPFETGFDLTLRPERLKQPVEWKRPPDDFRELDERPLSQGHPKAHIEAVFDTMERADWHVYQVLTKRSSLMQKFVNDRYGEPKAPRHIWFGVSVENAQAVSRIAHLQKANAAVRFLSDRASNCGSRALSTSMASIGSLSAARAVPVRDQWTRRGQSTCATSVSPHVSRSSSSNGADALQKPADACLRAANGTSFRQRRAALAQSEERPSL